ncbi:RidA family protein [Pikeienuella piscinae]|uniref:RidA family protein n=1 Tax=Pikeienuella piscinae TaxID=2748098 RepID=A0A7L5BXB4_9RHOB|nr:RidA family protein [Pikeienuella piscinae]QIE57020.1 RidA family protein [Pikeienuella piscinae]
MTIERFESGPRMSMAVAHGGLVFTAGQVAAKNAGAAIDVQTAEILEKIDSLLATAGTDKSRLLSVSIWISDMADFDAMNAVYDAWVDKKNPPARACVEAKLASDKFIVEIAAIAAR